MADTGWDATVRKNSTSPGTPRNRPCTQTAFPPPEGRPAGTREVQWRSSFPRSCVGSYLSKVHADRDLLSCGLSQQITAMRLHPGRPIHAPDQRHGDSYDFVMNEPIAQGQTDRRSTRAANDVPVRPSDASAQGTSEHLSSKPLGTHTPGASLPLALQNVSWNANIVRAACQCCCTSGPAQPHGGRARPRLSGDCLATADLVEGESPRTRAPFAHGRRPDENGRAPRSGRRTGFPRDRTSLQSHALAPGGGGRVGGASMT